MVIGVEVSNDQEAIHGTATDQKPLSEDADSRREQRDRSQCSRPARFVSPRRDANTTRCDASHRFDHRSQEAGRRLERRLRRLSRRGFAVGGAAALAGVAGWRWLVTRGEEDGLPWPLRRVLEFDERLARGLFRPSRLSPQFPRSAARMPRVNGSIGLDADLDPASVEAPGHRVGGRAVAAVVHPRPDQGPSQGGDDDRAELHRGLERRSCTGPARDWPTSPR